MLFWRMHRCARILFSLNFHLGEWSAEAAVAPPEGFVSDYENLSEHVDNELEAVQFLLTDIGSDWVPTETRYTLEHQGRTEVVLSRIGEDKRSKAHHKKGKSSQHQQ